MRLLLAAQVTDCPLVAAGTRVAAGVQLRDRGDLSSGFRVFYGPDQSASFPDNALVCLKPCHWDCITYLRWHLRSQDELVALCVFRSRCKKPNSMLADRRRATNDLIPEVYEEFTVHIYSFQSKTTLVAEC